jgi:site-specific DNA recombinase
MSGARSGSPRSVYVKESAVVPKLDEWIGTFFDPGNLDATCEALAAAGVLPIRIKAAKRKLAYCDTRLAKYRAALDVAADPAIVPDGSPRSKATHEGCAGDRSAAH